MGEIYFYIGGNIVLWLIRIALLAIIIFLIVKGINYVYSPKRKLKSALEDKKFYFNDTDDIQENFFITFKGALFEGEKYIEKDSTPADVVSIFVWPHKTSNFDEFTREDFLFLEKEINIRYPNSFIDWQNPISKVLKENQ